MEFDDNDMVIVDSLNASEATAYISFLYVERGRHVVNAEDARNIWSPATTKKGFTKAWIEFWKSTERRHLKDIEMIDLKLKEVRERFNLNEKI